MQKMFFQNFKELNPENAKLFVERYIKDKKLDMNKIREEIEKKWKPIEADFFKRADAIFKTSLPLESITAYLTINDRCSYNFQRNEFFIHTHLPATNKTIMHELWHWYFYYTKGQDIMSKHGKKIFNMIKESLTVLLNIKFNDLLENVKDIGYPQHAEVREFIANDYQKNNDLYNTIFSTLKFILKKEETNHDSSYSPVGVD